MYLTIAAQVERKALGNASQITFVCKPGELIGDDDVRSRFPFISPHATVSSASAGRSFIEHAVRKSEAVEGFLNSPILDIQGGARLSFSSKSISAQVFWGDENAADFLPDLDRALESPNLFLWMSFDLPQDQQRDATKAMDDWEDIYLLGAHSLQLVVRHVP